MATYEEAMTALRNAHEAGDTEAASRLAQIASGLKNSSQPSPGFWEGAKGTAAAAGDILTGIGKGLVLQPLMATAGKIADPSMSVQDTFEAAGAALDETYPAFGRNMKDNKGYTAPMYPIEKLGEGMQWLAKKGSFGNRDVEGSLNIGLNFAPIPFAKPIGKAVAKGVSAIDPTLRNVKAPNVSKTEGLRAEKTTAVVPEDTSVKVDPMADEYTTLMREKLELESTKATPETKAQIKALEQRMLDLNKQAVEQRIKENKLQKESAFNDEEVAARAEQERLAGNEKFLEAKQQEMWATDHPGDLAKSGEMAAREIPPELTKQEEMFGPNFALEHDGQMPLFKDEPSTALKEQSDLFPPQTNMHRDFTDLRVDDGKGGERPLTRDEFVKTHQALAMEPGTKHVLPKDMEVAFRDYLEQVNGKQQDMFDVGSRTEAWKQETAQKTYEQSIPELLDNHPLVQKAEKRTATAGGILTKMQMAGEKNASKLARAAKDLDMFMEAEKKTRANVEAKLRTATPKKSEGVPSPQSGTRKQGVSSPRSKQGGMLYLGEKQSKALETIKEIKPLEKMVPEHTTVADTPEGVVAKAAQASDVADRGLVGKTAALFTKGFLYEKKKTNNPVVKYTYDRISDGIDAVTTKLHTLLQEDLLPKFRALDTPELVELYTAMHDAMMGKYELSASDLAKHGFSEKQIATWESLQRGYDESFNSINTALEKAGHKPITRYTAYMAGMATGDFRTAIVKKVEGKEPVFVGFVGSNVKWMRDQRVKAFLKDNPEYSVGAESFHGKGAVRGDKAATMMEALQMLSEHSPDMDAFAKQLSEHLTGDAYNYMNAKTHTMEKKGVFGMEGSKQWVTGIQSLLPLSAEQRKAVIAKQNALDGFRAQVRYIETMATWSEMSKVTEDLKKVYTDPSIQERQANAITMSKEYLRNALGDNPSKVGPAIDRVASTIGESIGLGPSILGSAIRGGKQGINTIFFALNPQFLMTNAVQGALMSPLVVNSMRQKGFDVARFDKIGLKETTKAYMDGYKQWQNPNRDAFSTAMWKYGHEHGISSTQIFEHSTDIRKGVAHGYHSVMEFGLGKAEGLPRSGTYAMISNILRDNGYGNHPDIFKVAREITDTVMVDYRRHEGQRINNYFGPAAPLFRNLSAYAGNANSLMASFAREAWQTKDGQVLIAAMLTGLAIHGAMGFPGFAEADKLTEVISAAIGKPTTLTNEVMKATAQYPKEVGDVIATGFGATLGLDLHQTLGRSSILPSQLGAGGAGKLLTGGEAAFKAVTSPSEMNTKRLVHELSPKLARNWQDLEWFSQGDMAMNKKEGFSTQGAYRRTEEDKTIHKLGATSVNEFKNKEMMRQQTLQDTHLREKQTSIINKLMDKRVSSSGITERDIETSFDKYIEVEGDPRKFVQALKDMEIGVNTTMFERYVINKARGGNISAVKALQRMQEKAQ